ncbi:MAG TPA: hypothetical protein VK553_05600 [Candidatus Nitrosopolaris rasttigaisensis]|nr:hypothetical protein [Candidatus Nitrosopolaris rasttigaisensis]
MFKIKCKLCESILEGITKKNVSCACGEVILDGYNELIHVKKDRANAVEIDSEGNPIQKAPQHTQERPTREELIAELDRMQSSFENLPSQAMAGPINHYDFASLLLLVSAILKSE